MKKKVLMLRTNRVDPDPRVEKEINSLLLSDDIVPEVFAWDRTADYKYRKELLKLENGNAVIHRIGIKAGWGVGIRKNAFAFIQYTFRTFFWLMKNIRKYEVIHACDLQTMIPAFIPLLLFRKKLVYDLFDFFSDTAHGAKSVLSIAKWVEIFIINHADVTIICSEKRREQIRPAKPKKICVIHNAPSIEQISVNDKKVCLSKSDAPKIVYVGNLVEDRCIRNLVDIAREMPEIEMHIGGMGSLSDYVEQSAKSIDNLYFYGKMEYSDVLSLEKECDIMIALYDRAVPNHKYAAPNKFYEALALGKPLVMLHNTGVDDVIDRYSIGMTVDQNNESIKSGIGKLIKNRAEWDKIAKKERALFEKSYSWNIMEKRLKRLYSYVIEKT